MFAKKDNMQFDRAKKRLNNDSDKKYQSYREMYIEFYVFRGSIFKYKGRKYAWMYSRDNRGLNIRDIM